MHQIVPQSIPTLQVHLVRKIAKVRRLNTMPIVVKEKEWAQQEASIEITVPLKGHSKADVYCTIFV